MKTIFFAALAGLSASLATPASAQQTVTLEVSVKDNRFEPSELRAPANTGISIRIKNLGAKPVEFESKSLRVEKVIGAKQEGVVRVRPLAPGRYEFFDEFNERNRGFLVVQ